MQHKGFSSYASAVLVPVASLRSSISSVCGEFNDLKLLGDWCSASGIHVIQILPVNDTGDDSSPYSALSAFALHPVYISLKGLSELAKLPAAAAKQVQHLIKEMEKKHSDSERVQYLEIYREKIAILEEIWESVRESTLANGDFQKWIDSNKWVVEYGVFRALKQKHNNEGWQTWRKEFKQISIETIKKFWNDALYSDAAHFYAWIQWRLEEQFVSVAHYLESKGVSLKGDIPILMNEDSVDVWAHAKNFHLDLRAGAPPDAFSITGQNWGFPIYNWEYQAQKSFDWWKSRLKQADKFYHAYRIDHVLGFFRIWTIKRENNEGLLGHFRPSIYLSRNDFQNIGFDDGRIRWLSEPHVPGWKLTQIFGLRSVEVIGRCFQRIGNEDLYLFKSEITGERAIRELPFTENEMVELVQLFHDRALLEVDDGLFAATWQFRSCERFQGLLDHEKRALEELIARRGAESEALWKKQGQKLLGFMKETVPMLTCAEDLGVIPSCVPEVLAEKQILGLKIPRWARNWGEPGDPYIPIEQYPLLSVCAASVHDTSTLRGWWELEGDRESFWGALGFTGPCPAQYTDKVAEKVMHRILETSSMIAVFQLQDFFALSDSWRHQDPKAERVNVPGTVGPENWSYRMPRALEALVADKDFAAKVKTLLKDRSARTLPRI